MQSLAIHTCAGSYTLTKIFEETLVYSIDQAMVVKMQIIVATPLRFDIKCYQFVFL